MKNYLPYLGLLLLIVLVSVMFLVSNKTSKINISEPNPLSSHWTYKNELISLPIKLDVDQSETVTIERELSLDFNETQFLMLRTSLQDVSVYLEGELIYEKTYGGSLLKPYASMWHFITLPRQTAGQTLSIELTSPYQQMSGQINQIYYGTHAMHYAHLFRTYGLRLAIGLLVFTIGLLVVVSHFAFAKKQERGFLYAGMFAIFLSLWMIAESRMLQFMTGSELLMGSLAYIALPIFPIPFIRYLKEYVLRRNRRILSLLMMVFILQFFMINLFSLTGVFDFFESVIVSQILLIIGILIALILLIIEVKKDKNERAFKFIKAFLVLVAFAAIEIINFLLGGFENTSLYLSLGIMIIMVALVINYVRYLLGRLKISYEKEFYEKLAYIDYVTQGKNRLAFERDLDLIFNDDERKKNLRLIMFDLDELKRINDVYGHVEGDVAIKKAFDLITELFKDFGVCYRIGGDEFACLYTNTDEVVYQTKKQILEKQVDQFEKDTPYHFGLSLGSALLSDGIDSKTLIETADADMYTHKYQHKKAQHKA